VQVERRPYFSTENLSDASVLTIAPGRSKGPAHALSLCRSLRTVPAPSVRASWNSTPDVNGPVQQTRWNVMRAADAAASYGVHQVATALVRPAPDVHTWWKQTVSAFRGGILVGHEQQSYFRLRARTTRSSFIQACKCKKVGKKEIINTSRIYFEQIIFCIFFPFFVRYLCTLHASSCTPVSQHAITHRPEKSRGPWLCTGTCTNDAVCIL
jgi:hypothetical protein